VHPNLNCCSRLEDHYNILDDASYAAQGSDAYAAQISDDGQRLSKFKALSEKWKRAAEYCAFFPNVLYRVHKEQTFANVLIPKDRKSPLNALPSIPGCADAINCLCFDASKK
tara:strand:- start:4783 stop:5118 length:336 start_codon:yes stop_codon:yes gene_type:complete